MAPDVSKIWVLNVTRNLHGPDWRAAVTEEESGPQADTHTPPHVLRSGSVALMALAILILVMIWTFHCLSKNILNTIHNGKKYNILIIIE